MREAAETLDDVRGGSLRISGCCRRRIRANKAPRTASLVGDVLGMHQRQVEEGRAGRAIHLLVEAPDTIARGVRSQAPSDRWQRRAESSRNMLRGNWSSTMISASAPSGVRLPVAQLALRRPLRRSARKPSRHRAVEVVVLLEPLVLAGGAPEGEHVIGGFRRRSSPAPLRASARRTLRLDLLVAARGRSARRPWQRASLK